MLKHKPAIQEFLNYIKTNSPVETTTRYIAETFFRNNKDLSTKVIKRLKDNGVLYTNKSYCKGRGQKWYYLENNLSFEEMIQVPVNQVPVNQVPVNQVPVNQVPVEINYKGIKIVKEHISIEDKLLASQTYEMLGELLREDKFIEALMLSGLSKEKSWFLYKKIVEKRGHYSKQNY